MREVRACDFCGAGAAGVFEVLPAGVDGDDPKRMLLCADCRDTLSGVVDPLLAALDAGTTLDGDTDTAGASAEAGAETEAGTDGGAEGASTASTSAPSPEPGPRDESAETHEGGGRTLRNRGGTPKGYSKVMRFLEGREFPMERAAAEEMATEAYGLERESVAAAIDHAAKHGRLREASGKLFR
jgi:hypothetical protein